MSSQSIRLRVTYAELDELKNGATLCEQIAFPQNIALTFSLKTSSNQGCYFSNNSITFDVPACALDDLSKKLPSKSGIEWEMKTPHSTSLRITLEVDVKSKWKI